MVGERLSHYRITGRLGAGGMGVVYEAQDLTLGRLVAIKVLPPGLLADRATLLRFQREARAASALNHPHICIVHELGEHENQPFIVMERLHGRTLKHALRAGPLDCPLLLDLAWQIADALDAAHRAGIVHRDLKPDNVFVTQQQLVKLLDFGLAKLVDGYTAAEADPATAATLEEPITEIGRAMGTPLYMSPEQTRGEDVDCRTDLFSFGAVLYEMATGRRPFAGATSEAVSEAVRSTTPAPPSAGVAGLPAGFDALVAKALEKDRELRYQTAADLKADLARLRRDSQVASAALAPAADVRAGESEDRGSALRRHALPRWSWAAAAAIVFTAGLALWTGRGAIVPKHPPGPRFSSLAVLPLENLARDVEQQYFADGMTEALITNLSGIPGLRVISRTSSQHVREVPGRRLPEIARILNVDAVVEGTVLRSGDRVRIYARLIDTAGDQTVWANAYERDFQNVLGLQADVAAAIAREIGGRLTSGPAHADAPRPVDSKAYELYLKGRYFWNMYTEEGWNKAIDYFKQAIRVDGRYAPAWAGLADSYYQLSTTVLPPDQVIPDARSAATRALELDDSLAEAHASLGVIKSQYDWDRAGAQRELTRAVALNPNYATAHQWLGMLHYGEGRFAEALAELERAWQLDPLSLSIAAIAVWPLPYLGRYDEAIARLEQAAEMHPDMPDIPGMAHDLRAEVWLQKGRPEAAVAEWLQGAEVRTVSGDTPASVSAMRTAFARGGMSGYWRKRLELAQRKYRDDLARANRLSPPHFVTAYPLARLHARLGQTEEAFAVLDGCVRTRDELLVWLKAESLRADSPWTSIRSDARFTALLRRIGLERSDVPSGPSFAAAAKRP